MKWRCSWFRSRGSAIVVSASVWLVVAALLPAVFGVLGMVGVAFVAGWRSRVVRRLWFGARPASSAESEAVLHALVPVEWLRGRNQPRVWVTRRLEHEVVALGPGDLGVGDLLVGQLCRQPTDDAGACRKVVRALALGEVHQSRLVAAVDVFCIPWSLLARGAREVCRSIGGVRLIGFAWQLRWLVVGLAAVDLSGRADWAGLVMLLLAATATVTTPRCNRAWTRRQQAMAHAAEQRLTDSLLDLDSCGAGTSPADGPTARPIPGGAL